MIFWRAGEGFIGSWRRSEFVAEGSLQNEPGEPKPKARHEKKNANESGAAGDDPEADSVFAFVKPVAAVFVFAAAHSFDGLAEDEKAKEREAEVHDSGGDLFLHPRL